ncbi:STAS domain-containing protein [Neisseria animalis]|uniref:STAS domain-containing protein n=1 Tax=Neisseria animalis TaxID=492 RepID=A0A5P3MRX0_NEIAN|nr:STAS domain-containing protein [Neisseria animalis]QEY23845.1 STAS domain-containing protein [Neisseria animalis]ROW32087.1 STAS domain-containing protein [Neisseria animalis]VEE05686.1 NTP binding protein [Neisseria animalis]
MNSELRDGVLYIGGEVTVKTVTDTAYTHFKQQCRLQNLDTVDFASVSRADSACLSLLLTAQRLNPNVRFRHLPESVRALADLYEINDWLSS